MGSTGHRNHKRRSTAPTLPAPAEFDVQPCIVVAGSSTELNQWIGDRRRHHPHVAAAAVPHSERQGIPPVASAVLNGIGKRPDLTAQRRPVEHVAGAWLLEGAATDVIITEAQKLSGWLVPELIAWFCGLGVRLWLVFGTVEDPPVSTVTEIVEAAEKLADEWQVEVLDEKALRAAFPDTIKQGHKTKQASRWRRPSGLPMLPRSDGTVFRSKVKEQLPAAQARKVDAVFVATVKELRAAISAALAEPNRQKGRLVARTLRPAFEATRDTEELLLTARAAQVAAITEGWLVRVDPTLLIAAGELRPRAGKNSVSDAWARLDAYRDPDYGAAAALHEAGIGPGDLAAITLGDVEDDEAVTVAGHVLSEPGARFVRVLVQYRRLVGASGGDPLFATHRQDGIRPNYGNVLLATPDNELGVTITDRSFGRKTPTDKEWLRRYGVTLTHLSSTKAAR